MNLSQIHHVAIITAKYEASKTFYVDKLGFQVIRENYRAHRDDYKLDLQLGDCELEIFGIKNAPKRPSYPEACGLRHLAFKVENIEEVVAALSEKGIECEVSLENTMACGIGACLCCVEDTKDEGNVCVCKDGPVFNINRLKW